MEGGRKLFLSRSKADPQGFALVLGVREQETAKGRGTGGSFKELGIGGPH